MFKADWCFCESFKRAFSFQFQLNWTFIDTSFVKIIYKVNVINHPGRQYNYSVKIISRLSLRQPIPLHTS